MLDSIKSSINILHHTKYESCSAYYYNEIMYGYDYPKVNYIIHDPRNNTQYTMTSHLEIFTCW
eukprot:UN10622